MKAALLIVDGHSVIFQTRELSRMHAVSGESARELLIQKLTALQDATGSRVAVVFDGVGPQPTEASPTGGIQVFYSAGGQTADALIERLVAKYAQGLEVTVATDDHMEQTTVRSLGAEAISCERLHDRIREAEQNISSAIERLRKK